jgi:hypothetical protein
MKYYAFLFFLLIISCKKNEANLEVIPKDVTLDLKYEVLNQLIKSDSLMPYFNHFIYCSTLTPVNIDVDENEIRPLGVDLKYDSIFLQKDSAYYKRQVKVALNFKFDKTKIKSNLKYITGQELQKLSENKVNDFWTEFNTKYKSKCICYYSVPFFNKDKTICVVQYSTSCGPLAGDGKTSLYEKINGKWTIIKSYDKWVS